MLKRILVLLFSASMLCFLFFSIRTKIGEQVTINKNPVKYYPADVSIFLKFKNFSNTLHHFTETNMMWSDWVKNQNNKSNDFIESIDDILKDSLFNICFENGNSYLAIYKQDSMVNWLLVNNVLKHQKDIEFSEIQQLLNENQKYFNNQNIRFSSPFVLVSNEDELIDKFLKNLYNKDSIIENGLNDLVLFDSESSPLSIWINLKNESQNIRDKFFAGSWAQLDIDYSSSKITLSGLSNQQEEISLFNPKFSSFDLVKELDLKTYEERQILFDSSSLKMKEISSIRLKLVDKIQSRNHDIILLEENIKESLHLFFINDSIKDLLDNSIEKTSINQTIFKKLLSVDYADYDFKDKYIFTHNDFVFIASELGERELEYQLNKTMSKQQKQDDFLSISNSYQPSSYSLYADKDEMIDLFAKNQSLLFNSSFLEFCGGVKWNVNKYDNRLYYGISLYQNNKQKTNKNVLWKLPLKDIVWGPYAVKNHRTNTRDIVVQDSANVLYYIGANGKLKWTKSIESKIKGAPSQIDIYKNNKFQLLFNSNKLIYLIDILGNDVDGFPIFLPHQATNQVVAFDYDKNKNYRFLISLNNSKIYNYNVDGEQVSGWFTPNLTSNVMMPITHFAINGLDYIMIIDESGKILMCNRKGEDRYKLKSKIPMTNRFNYALKKSFSIDSSSIIFEDSSGLISSYVFSEESAKQIIKMDDDSIERVSIIAFNQNNINLCLKNHNQLKIQKEKGQAYDFTFDYDFAMLDLNGEHNYFPIFNSQLKEIQFINQKFSLLPTLYRATEKSCIYDINNDNIYELVSVLNENILVCYQIADINSPTNY
tara:strand:+ start:485 stop:2953 length:2469 start_codon:yes stop_codon:yes gene_type:complete